jgi:hypothetical protein
MLAGGWSSAREELFVFDVSDDSDRSHESWPELRIEDRPGWCRSRMNRRLNSEKWCRDSVRGR